MEIKVCNDKKQWNAHLLAHTGAEFLQSWEWGEFQEQTGNKAVRLLWDGGLAQGFAHRLAPGMRYLYLPRIMNYELGVMNQTIDFLKRQNYIFLRIEPLKKILNIKYSILNIKNRQPSQTFILDLIRSEEELLRNMHPKTRYNINLAQKKGVVVREEKNAEIFWKLNQETIKRSKFKSHNRDYYKKMLEVDICHQLTAYYQPFGSAQSKPIASNILIIFNNTCTYLHGASSFSDRNLMAPYLLQWEGIKLAKKMNCKHYDFWGIAPIVEKGDNTVCFHDFCWNANHKWAGVTRFKAGFGGNIKNYPRAFDVILKPLQYRLYKLIHKILVKY